VGDYGLVGLPRHLDYLRVGSHGKPYIRDMTSMMTGVGERCCESPGEVVVQ